MAAKTVFVWKERLNPASIIKNNPKIDITIKFKDNSLVLPFLSSQSEILARRVKSSVSKF